MNEALCINSHGAAGEGCRSGAFEGTAGETNPKKDRKKEYAFKKNASSRSIGPARMPLTPVRAVTVSPCLHGTHCYPHLSPQGWGWGCSTGIPGSHCWSCNSPHAAWGKGFWFLDESAVDLNLF